MRIEDYLALDSYDDDTDVSLSRRKFLNLTGGCLTILFCVGKSQDVLGQEERRDELQAGVSNSIRTTDLRCEYRVDPLGVDVAKPRLYWLVASDQRAQSQSAYRILVASDENKLKLNQGDLWDSGKVASDQSSHVVYAGNKLSSQVLCYWKVRLWDKNDEPSPWSKPARWSMGLLNAGDWKAQWITPYPIKEPIPEAKLEKWISHPSGGKDERTEIKFRRELELDESVTRIVIQITVGMGHYTLYANGNKVESATQWWRYQLYELEMNEELNPGKNVIAIAAGTLYGTSGIHGIACGIHVYRTDTSQPKLLPWDPWLCSDKSVEGWTQVDFDAADWVKPKAVANYGDRKPWGEVAFIGSESESFSVAQLRKNFTVKKPVRRAMVYITALGLYELYINGQRVSRDYFAPGWPEYPKRIYYQSYEVTDLLQANGNNAMGVVLGAGWAILRHNLAIPYLRGQLCMEYADGSTEIITSDESWKSTHDGPILTSHMFHGETYDSRKEMAGWNQPSFDDSFWKPVRASRDQPRFDDSFWKPALAGREPAAKLQAHPGEPVRKIMEIKPVKITEPKPGVYVFDMGQNMVGWARLKVKGTPGDKVVLHLTEMLNPDGTIHTLNMGYAKSTDTYILKGKDVETWEPRFTFHGFQYVEVTGFPGTPSLDAVTGVVLHSDAPITGSFECSNTMLNQLHRNIVWTQRGNYLEVPTDCPTRDERYGWTGDAQVFIRTATYNMDVAAFFTSWLNAVNDCQSPEGAYSHFAPVSRGHGSPGWADAGITCPWTIYQMYGDARILEKHYDKMGAWIEYCRENSNNLVRPEVGFHDHLNVQSLTPSDVIATAYFGYSTSLMAKIAQALGKNDDAQKYRELFENIKAAFNKAYVADDGKIKGDTQTAYLQALCFDLLPKDKQGAAAQHLAGRIKERNWHLSTGFLGVNILLPTLEEIGRLDIAYRLLTNETYPSWGYLVKQGATTMWERWAGWQSSDENSTGMGFSLNHYPFGSVGQWMFSTVAGIDTDGPGFKRIIIRPRPGGDLTYVKASYKSIHGTIATHWELTDGNLKLNVTIPANTIATVYVPAVSADSVTESSEEANQAPGVTFLHMEDNAAVYEVGSGTYSFASRDMKSIVIDMPR